MSKDTGGPAFPLPVGDQECCGRFESGYGGMTLRDYFAAKVVQGILSNPNCEYDWNDLAEDAYRMSDAMLAEREKGE